MTSGPTTRKPRLRVTAAFALLLMANAAVLLFAPLIGTEKVALADVFGRPGPEASPEEIARREIARLIVFEYRLPRVALGLLVGGWLALAGGVFQAALRNELATPYTLGVSGGAALGALSALRLSGTSAAALAWGFWLRPAAALAGAMACAAIIGGLARARARSRRGPLDAASILLAGATINILCGAGVLLIQYLSDPYETFAAIRWLMGGLDAGGRWESSAILAALGFPLALLLCLQGRALDALNLGEATAHSLGVSVGRTRTLALGGASALAALCVAFAGPIGFVGLIAPHAVRLVLGPSNRLVLPASILLGSAFLAGCDAAGRALFATEVPAGLATALLGGPVFLALLLRRGGDS